MVRPRNVPFIYVTDQMECIIKKGISKKSLLHYVLHLILTNVYMHIIQQKTSFSWYMYLGTFYSICIDE